jgi:hypothetical protein
LLPANAPVAADWLKNDGANVIEQRTDTQQLTTKMAPCKQSEVSFDMSIPPVGLLRRPLFLSDPSDGLTPARGI